MQKSFISKLIREFIHDLQEFICKLSKQDKDCFAKQVIEYFSFNIVIRIYAIHTFTGRLSRFTPGTDEFVIKSMSDCIVLLEKTKLNNLKIKKSFVKRIFISKKYEGQFRPLAVFNIIERILQKCLIILIEPYYDVKLHDEVFGFRSGRSPMQAVGYFLKLCSQGQKRKVIIGLDIKNCFDNISTEVLKNI